jgi:hypothetical protein
MSKRSRRTFIRSVSMFISGFGLFRSSVFSAGRFMLKEEKIPVAGIFPFMIELSDLILPQGISAVWDLAKAYHETTPTREKICINGLWQWQPGMINQDRPPSDNWGFFKVPGPWPRNSNYNRKDSQTVFAHPAWKDSSSESLITACISVN